MTQPITISEEARKAAAIMSSHFTHLPTAWSSDFWEQTIQLAINSSREQDKKRIEELEKQIAEEKKWKEEDPRMLLEQIRVADIAFNHQLIEKAHLEKQILELREANSKIGKWLSAALEDPSVCFEMKQDIRYWMLTNARRELEKK